MWFFGSPQIVFGEDSLSWLNTLSGQRAFIVTDPTMQKLGFVDRTVEQLKSTGIQTIVFAEVEPDPCLETVQRCAQQMNEYEPDLIIGLGGGSCLDAAKAAWFLYERPDVVLEAINPMESFGLRKKARLVTVPTTSGTGSDVSWGFALADRDHQNKLVRVTRELVPDMALVDPCFTVGLPPQVTADTGMDVLSPAVEAYTCNWHNDFTDGLSLKAIELVFKYLPRAYANGMDIEAREHMHNAATIAGLSFSNTAIILGHSLAHALGGYFHTTHGRAVGMFMPYTIQFIAKTAGNRYAEIADYLHLPAKTEEEGVRSLISAIDDLLARFNQPRSIADTGISTVEFETALPHLVENTLNAIELVATPRIPDGDQIEKLFRYAYEGKVIDF